MGSYSVPMVNTSTPKAGYARRLEHAMGSTTPPVTVRGLARDMRPNGIESMRRLIRRFLNGDRAPGPQVAGEIIAALKARGADTTALESDDDEDSQAMYRDLLDISAQLEHVRQRITQSIRGAA